MNNPLVQPDPGLAIWTIITFLVLLWLLAKFAWKPMLRALDTRQETIRKSLEDAEHAKREKQELRKESEKIIRSAHAQAESIIATSRAESEKLREEIKQKARMDAETIVREAREQIEMETVRALRQIRSEIADLSVTIASSLIQRNLAREDNIDLIEATLKKIESEQRPS